MTAKRSFFLLPILVLLFVSALAGPARAAGPGGSSFPTEAGMHVTSDYGKGIQYVARETKAGCGGQIQVRSFRGSTWSPWENLDCTKLKLNSFGTPTVTVDRATNHVYVVWMRTAIIDHKWRSFVFSRMSADGGRTWQPPRKLVGVPNNAVSAGIGASADEGVLWLAWQSLESIGDTVPAINFAPFNGATGTQLQDSLLTVPSNRTGRAAVKVEASKGQATLFWNIGSGKSRWRAASTRPATGISGASRTKILKRGTVRTALAGSTLTRGDNGQIYQLIEQRNPISSNTWIGAEIWNPRKLIFTTAASLTANMASVGNQGVAVDAGPDDRVYIAYLDFGALTSQIKNPCLVLIDGAKGCDFTVAPEPGPITLHVASFSAGGAPEATSDVVLPFSAWATPGEQIAEFVDPVPGVDGITTTFGGRARLTYVGGYVYGPEAMTPDSPYTLGVNVTDPLF